MFRGLTPVKANMRLSRRAMLDTLMRHLDMVRLSAGLTLVVALLGVGCTGLIGGGTTTAQLTPEQQAAEAKWTSEALPVFTNNTCIVCHGGTAPTATGEFFLTGTGDDIRTTLLGFSPQVINLDAPASSRVLVKGAHEGPALGATDSASILDWINAEKDAAAAGSGSGTPTLETAKIQTQICTGGTAGDVSECQGGDANHDGVIACCPINKIPLDDLALPGATINFIAQPLDSDTYVTDLYLAAGSDGVYMEHPLFASWPPTGDAIPDGLDRFFAVKMNLAPATGPVSCPPIGPSCDHIGPGAAAFVGFAPENELSISFLVIEAYHPDATMPPATVGCATNGFAAFIQNVKPQLMSGTCTSCHGGQNNGATGAMDLTGLANTTSNTTCLQVRNHIQTDGTPSPLLLAPEAGQDATHPYKMAAAAYTTFMTNINTWIAAEVSGT